MLAGLAGVAEEGGSGDAVVRLVHVLQHGWPAETPQHRRVVAALGRGAMRQLRATVSASVAAASPWLAGLYLCPQAGDIAWLTSECEPSERHDFTGVVEDAEDLLARLRL